jgi:hypothetical protein
LSLPIGPQLSDDQARLVIDRLATIAKE